MSNAMASLISRREVESQYNELLKIKVENEVIQVDLTQIHGIINDMNASQTQLNETVAHQEVRMALKLDRSELPHLQSLASKVLTYEDFKHDVGRRVAAVEAVLPDMQSRLGLHDQELVGVQTDIRDNLVFNLNKMALKKDVHILAKELKHHQEVLQTVAFQSNVVEVRDGCVVHCANLGVNHCVCGLS
jgi:cyanate lyase